MWGGRKKDRHTIETEPTLKMLKIEVERIDSIEKVYFFVTQ